MYNVMHADSVVMCLFRLCNFPHPVQDCKQNDMIYDAVNASFCLKLLTPHIGSACDMITLF